MSHSVRQNEAKILDYISNSISKWGFELYTLGIPPLKKHFTDEELLESIKFEIKKADIVFAIATKRDQLLNSMEWKTFEWLQSETAIAYALNKQIIIFVERGVNLSGLPSKSYPIQYESNNLNLIDDFFERNMLIIRNNHIFS